MKPGGGTWSAASMACNSGACSSENPCLASSPTPPKQPLPVLVDYSLAQNIELIDCQLASGHLRSLGSRPMPRCEFLGFS